MNEEVTPQAQSQVKIWGTKAKTSYLHTIQGNKVVSTKPTLIHRR